MFLFYYVWGFFIYLIFFFKDIIEYFYIKYNKNSIIFKRDFNDLTYFEKIFLTFFYRKNIFNKSIANIYTNNNLFNFRKSKFPLIFFFHLYFDRMNYKFSNLKNLNKLFFFFNNSKPFSKIFINLNFFFKKNYYSNYIKFLIIQKIFYKRYYNLCSSIYFKNLNFKNQVKLNWIFYLYLLNSSKKLVIYDLSKYSDWYDFNFKKNKKNIFNKIKLDKKTKKLVFNFRNNNIKYFTKIYSKYNNFFKKIFFSLKSFYKNIFIMSYKFNHTKLFFNKSWKNGLNLFYPIRYNESSVSKYINLENINSYLFFYIRKNRIFNKGRYSRNRQLYRTGVYWCLWLNIILVYGLYFLFYRFTFNFGYFWWGVLIFSYSTIFSRIIKYNYHNLFYIFKEFSFFINWVGLIWLNFYKIFISFLLKYINFFKKNSFLFSIWKFFFDKIKSKRSNKFIYLWETMKHKDESFFKYKTIIHWFGQVFKLITY